MLLPTYLQISPTRSLDILLSLLIILFVVFAHHSKPIYRLLLISLTQVLYIALLSLCQYNYSFLNITTSVEIGELSCRSKMLRDHRFRFSVKPLVPSFQIRNSLQIWRYMNIYSISSVRQEHGLPVLASETWLLIKPLRTRSCLHEY